MSACTVKSATVTGRVIVLCQCAAGRFVFHHARHAKGLGDRLHREHRFATEIA